jgi:predicted nuclease with TOPRIM domain
MHPRTLIHTHTGAAEGIGSKLQEHTVELDGLDDELQSNASRLDLTMEKLDKLLGESARVCECVSVFVYTSICV